MRAVGAGASIPEPVTGPESSRRQIADAEEQPSEHTQIAAPPAAFLADMARPRRSTTRPPAPPAPAEIQWYVAVDGEQQGPFARPGLIDKLLALPRDADVHVWNEKLDGWKPPRDLPEVARDLQARRRPRIPPEAPPRVPSPPRGAPMHSTHPPGGLRARLAASAAGGTTAPPAAAAASAVLGPPASGVRLPAPSGSSPSFGVRAVAAAAAPAAAPADIDPGPVLDTSAARPHPAAKGSNGVGLNGTAAASGPAATPAALAGGETSDALSALNLAATTAPASGAADGPRLLRHSQVVEAWSGTAAAKDAKAARHRNAKLIFACLGVVAVVVAVVALNATRKSSSSQGLPPPAPAHTDNQLNTLQEQIAKETQEEVKPATGNEGPNEPSKVKVIGGGKGRPAVGRPGPALRAAGAGAHGPAPATNPVDEAAAARFRGEGERTVQAASPSPVRAPASQEAIARVVKSNQTGIKNCYQRALLRDSSLTHGKLTIHLSIGISGRVKNIAINGPPQFRVLEPCVRDVIGRWVFPSSSDESETEFVYGFQGNE
jgi:hypothetical protein